MPCKSFRSSLLHALYISVSEVSIFFLLLRRRAICLFFSLFLVEVSPLINCQNDTSTKSLDYRVVKSFFDNFFFFVKLAFVVPVIRVERQIVVEIVLGI